MPRPAPHPALPRPGACLAALLPALALVGCADGTGAIAGVAVALGGLAAALAGALGLVLGRQGRGPGAAPDAPAAPAPPPPAAPPPRELADALPGPAVLLARHAEAWQLLHANAQARQRWPEALRSDGTAWPPGLAERLQDAASTPPWQRHDGPGWTLAWLPGPDARAAADERHEADSFSFTLSHDLRAPLRVVEGFTRIVKEDYGPQLDRVANDHLDRVLGAAARMNLMIDAMLALARLSQQPLSRQPVDLSQLAGFVLDDLRRAAPDREVEVEIDPGLVATGDPTLLRLVLDNLVGNAWKYTAKTALPRIELRHEPTADGSQLGFVVRDNGAGFDMRSADRLFGLFQRLHSSSDFPGHGVGLASVRRIVERHGGRIWAESEPGRGAAFHVVLAR